MKRFRLFTLLCLLIVLASGVFFVVVRHGQNARAKMPGECTIYGPEIKAHGLAANSAQGDSTLLDISALSAHDVWAVGEYDHFKTNEAFPLVEHWNGSQWRIVPTPASTKQDSGSFYSVKALSATDVWAVGGWTPGASSTAGLVEHWDGTTWSLMQMPVVGKGSTTFYSLAAVSPRDVWVVGSYTTANLANAAVIEHWNGAAWSTTTLPGGAVALGSVIALAANNIWAVGCGASSTTGYSTTLVAHWDGSSWSMVPSPNPPNPAFASYLNSVTALSANDIWAVGGYETTSPYTGYAFERLIEHWDGSKWSIIPSPPGPGTRLNGLYGASAASPNAVWAIGTAFSGVNGDWPRGFSEHWNGQKWNVVPIAHKGPSTAVYEFFSGITALADNDVWAVGGYHFTNISTGYSTIIEHWDGTKWSIVPSPNK